MDEWVPVHNEGWPTVVASQNATGCSLEEAWAAWAVVTVSETGTDADTVGYSDASVEEDDSDAPDQPPRTQSKRHHDDENEDEDGAPAKQFKRYHDENEAPASPHLF